MNKNLRNLFFGLKFLKIIGLLIYSCWVDPTFMQDFTTKAMNLIVPPAPAAVEEIES